MSTPRNMMYYLADSKIHTRARAREHTADTNLSKGKKKISLQKKNFQTQTKLLTNQTQDPKNVP